MRILKLALAGAMRARPVRRHGRPQAEPVKIRMSWVAPVANWASIILEKKDLLKHWASPTRSKPSASKARRR